MHFHRQYGGSDNMRSVSMSQNALENALFGLVPRHVSASMILHAHYIHEQAEQVHVCKQQGKCELLVILLSLRRALIDSP